MHTLSGAMRWIGALPPFLVAFAWLHGAPPPVAPAGQGTVHNWKAIPDWYFFDGEKLAGDVVPQSVQQTEARVRDGDDPRWAAPGWDDNAWSRQDNRYEVIPTNRGIFWVRIWVRSNGDAEQIPSLVYLYAPASSDFYWDGVLVNRSGTPGADRASEVPGPLSSVFEVPRAQLGPGSHLMALRLSTYHSNRPEGVFRLVVLNVRPDRMAEVNERRRLYPAMAVGAMLVTGVAALLLWLAAARLPALLAFSSLCLGSAMLVGLSLWRYVFPFPYSWSYAFWYASDAVSVVTAACLVLFVLYQFKVPRRLAVLAALALCEAALIGFQGPVPISVPESAWKLDVWSVAFLFALACALWSALKQGSAVAWIVSGCLAPSLFLYARDPVNFYRAHFLETLLPTLVGFIFAMALTVRLERREAQEARLMAARLEIDLLKKSLQPHFLMNTLTTLAQIVEEDPSIAVRLIDDVALEFRSLTAIAGLKSIPITRELELCATHLRVMSVRTERQWRLEAMGVDDEASVPPALFLTLIENGFSHQRASDGATTFTLRAERAHEVTRYTFFSPGAVSAGAEGRQGGLGLRYVKIRLEESWPGRWRLEHREVAEGWETVIDLAGPGVSGRAP